jgi:prepilin-type N-terminal cleavage/methylation domain-containing protein
MHKQNQSGFTMVEILVSLAVSSLLLFVMSAVLENAFQINGKTEKRAEASSLAFKKVQDYINLNYETIPIGDDVNGYEVEDFSAEAAELNVENAVAKVYIEPESQLDTSTVPTITSFNQTVQADSEYIASGSEINVVGVNDAAGFHCPGSSWCPPENISNDDFSDYTYNSGSPGPDNKPLPSIDLGSPHVVENIRVTWWSCFYGANNFRIEATNGNPNSTNGWIPIVTGLSDGGAACSLNKTQTIDVSGNTTEYQHWRMFIVDGYDYYWNVISELEAFSSGVPGDIVEQHGSDAATSPGALYFSSSDLQMSEDGSRGQQSVGVIFDDIDTPQGATIDNAYIEFTADESHSGFVRLRVSAINTDDAPTWVGDFAVDNAVDDDSSDGLVGTPSSLDVDWTPDAWSSGENGPDTRVNVTAIVQELVNRSGWQSDNRMAFAVQYVSGDSKRVATRNPAPELVLEWSETSTSTSPYVDADADGDVDNPTLVRVTVVINYEAYRAKQQVTYSTFIRRFGVGS